MTAALLALAAAPASAERSDWVRLAGEIAAPWPGIQEPAGNFPDFTDGLTPRSQTNGPGTRYGDSVLGLGLIQHGLRHDDRRMIDAGVRAVAWSVRIDRRKLQQKKPSVFESWAVAAAYNLVRRRIPNHPTFVRTKPAWRRHIVHIKPISTILHKPNTRRFSNHYLIEALEVFELRRTGIRTRDRAALVGPGFGRAYRIYKRMVNHGIPAIARRKNQRRRGQSTFLISDPPDYPLAYQGLAMGFYAEAIRMLGPAASADARATLRKAANASWLFAAPDGATGYAGRSMEESWAQAGTALGATVAAERPGASPGLRARYRALADSALTRLRDAYGPLPGRGYAFVPSLAIHPRLGARALEPYAGSPSFAGLTLVQLNWLLEEMPGGARAASRIAAASNFGTKLSRGQSEFATVRRGRNWFAVRAGQSRTRYPKDLRYDFGLIAFKRATRGEWEDVIPLRPLTWQLRDSAGPVLKRGGLRGLPWGQRFTIRNGAVSLHGGFRTTGGRWLRRGVRFSFVPTDCGVRVAWRGRRGDSYTYSSFVRSHRQDPAVSRTRVADSRQQITATPTPGSVRVDRRRYYSASDPKLRRVRMRWRTTGNDVIAVTTCGQP
jgi:hypothetical protein